MKGYCRLCALWLNGEDGSCYGWLIDVLNNCAKRLKDFIMLRQLLILGFVLIFCSIVRAEGRNEQSILPKPGGPFAIGTMKVFVTDSSYGDLYN